MVGGDARYGLGRLQRINWEDASAVFGHRVDLSNVEPLVETEVVLGHAEARAGANEEL
jgi:hypothetical protein